MLSYLLLWLEGGRKGRGGCSACFGTEPEPRSRRSVISRNLRSAEEFVAVTPPRALLSQADVTNRSSPLCLESSEDVYRSEGGGTPGNRGLRCGCATLSVKHKSSLRHLCLRYWLLSLSSKQ